MIDWEDCFQLFIRKSSVYIKLEVREITQGIDFFFLFTFMMKNIRFLIQVFTYDLLEDRRLDDIVKNFRFFCYNHKTSKFHVAVVKTQKTSKSGKNIRDTLAYRLAT